MGRDSPFILSPQPPSCDFVPTGVAGKTKSGRDLQAGPDWEPAPGKSSRGTQPRFSGHLLPSRFLPSAGQWLFPSGPGKSPVYVWDNNNRADPWRGFKLASPGRLETLQHRSVGKLQKRSYWKRESSRGREPRAAHEPRAAREPRCP